LKKTITYSSLLLAIFLIAGCQSEAVNNPYPELLALEDGKYFTLAVDNMENNQSSEELVYTIGEIQRQGN
jgi:hypothetical protein